MADRCPTCGQPLPAAGMISTAGELVAAMRVAPPVRSSKKWRYEEFREVYESGSRTNRALGSGQYFLTYGNGQQVSRAAIDEALRRGLIRLAYDDCDGCWCLAESRDDELGRG